MCHREIYICIYFVILWNNCTLGLAKKNIMLLWCLLLFSTTFFTGFLTTIFFLESLWAKLSKTTLKIMETCWNQRYNHFNKTKNYHFDCSFLDTLLYFNVVIAGKTNICSPSLEVISCIIFRQNMNATYRSFECRLFVH